MFDHEEDGTFLDINCLHRIQKDLHDFTEKIIPERLETLRTTSYQRAAKSWYYEFQTLQRYMQLTTHIFILIQTFHVLINVN